MFARAAAEDDADAETFVSAQPWVDESYQQSRERLAASFRMTGDCDVEVT